MGIFLPENVEAKTGLIEWNMIKAAMLVRLHVAGDVLANINGTHLPGKRLQKKFFKLLDLVEEMEEAIRDFEPGGLHE